MEKVEAEGATVPLAKQSSMETKEVSSMQMTGRKRAQTLVNNPPSSSTAKPSMRKLEGSITSDRAHQVLNEADRVFSVGAVATSTNEGQALPPYSQCLSNKN